ncbi:hypothetical protein SAMN04487850_0835 [Prevotella aff. ruminicola Tc2-24]|uniref:Uncharacterized protein n=1 Tax=Prevotella aff. ruminicola Tc2-24 TaxID=81582 RepID=A0A1I0MQ69_9BACT|nr:hypothetical protein SAMN04487850_0835 [Prevotella aff. ruminicola Tc2-24]
MNKEKDVKSYKNNVFSKKWPNYLVSSKNSCTFAPA